MAQISLTGEQWGDLHDAILASFPDSGTLKTSVKIGLGTPLNHIVIENAKLPDQVTQLIEWAESRDKLADLLQALRDKRFGNDSNVKLKAFHESIGGAIDDKSLEKILGRNALPPIDTERWRLAMVRGEATVCRVESPEMTAFGTGFLVGEDLVLTNQHVSEQADFEGTTAKVRFRFGYRTLANNMIEGGKTYALAQDWDVAGSPVYGKGGLDYALVRLAVPVGKEAVGGFQGAPARGWLVPSVNRPSIGQTLHILQHPKGETIKVSQGGLLRLNGSWMEYEVDTDHGSSGSPVFDNGWNLVGLHSREGQGPENKGILFTDILDDLKKKGVAIRTAPPA